KGATQTTFACVLLVVLGYGVARHGFLIHEEIPGESNFRKRMLALEFARDQQTVTTLVALDTLESKLSNDLKNDTRFFIPAYWLLFGLIGAFLYGQRFLSSKLWPFILPLIISMAALADVYENMAAEAALTISTGAAGIYPAAVVKWSAIAIACAC